MSLSDKAIQELVQKAASYEDIAKSSSRDYTTCLTKALECYNQIVDNATPHSYYFSQRAKIKHALAAASPEYDLASAIGDITSAIELDPDEASYYFRRANLHLEMIRGAISSAGADSFMPIIEDCKSCIGKDPSYPAAWIDLMAINLTLGNWDEVISLYGQCKPYIDSNEDNLYRSYLGCVSLIIAGDPLEKEDTKPLHRSSVPHIQALLGRDYLIIEASERIRALDLAQDKCETLGQITESFIAHYSYETQGAFLSTIGCPDEAIEAYDKALKADPDNGLLYYNKASCLVDRMHHEEALEAYNKAIELGIGYASAWLKKGGCLFCKGRFEEAIDAYNEALKLKPDDSEAWERIAECLRVLQRNREALQAYDKAISLKPDSISARLEKGDFLRDIGRFKEAFQVYDETIELEHGHIPPLLKKGKVLEQLEHYEDAIEVYDQVLELNPEDDIAWEAKGDCLDSLTRYEEAVIAYEKAIPQLQELCRGKSYRAHHLNSCLEKLEKARNKLRQT